METTSNTYYNIRWDDGRLYEFYRTFDLAQQVISDVRNAGGQDGVVVRVDETD